MFSIILFLNIFSLFFSFEEWWQKTKCLELNDTNFHEIVGKNKYVVVEFYTKWCRYCKQMAGEYDKLYENYKTLRPDVVVSKVEVQSNPQIQSLFGIFSFPYIALFHPGSTKIKDFFREERVYPAFHGWLERVAPKKNIKFLGGKKDEEKNKDNDSNNKGNMTEISEYIKSEFSGIKNRIKDIEARLNVTNIYNKTKEINTIRNDENKIVIKITPSFILKIIVLYIICRILIYNIYNKLILNLSFESENLPKVK